MPVWKLVSISVACSALLLPAVATAQISGQGSTWSASADELDTEFNHSQGETVTRLGVDITAVAGIDEGEVNTPDSFNVGLAAGVGYFPHEQASADIDASTTLVFSDDAEQDLLNNFAITPGTHLYPIPEIFIHAGLPIYVHPSQTLNILGGVGYEIPVNETQTLVGEVAITYPLSDEGEGVITLGGGTTLTF